MKVLKKVGTVLVVVGFFTVCFGQVTFTKMPQKLQLYARNLASDSGDVAISGTVNKPAANYQELRLKIFRNNIAKDSVAKTLQFTGNSAPFDISYRIKAELANYRFAVYGYNGTTETMVAGADSIVCGDVLIINGQSNAVAWNLSGSSDNTANGNQSPYIRVCGYGSHVVSDFTWRIGQGDSQETSPANTGQWGLRLARLIVDNRKIPVAIFNGAHGGQPIQFFRRNDANPTDSTTNYGRLLIRVRAAGLTQNIRAILWHQGENNAFADGSSLSIAGYKNAFQSLMGSWQTDYPSIEKFYLFQIRNGCGCPVDSVLKIKEAHRELAQLPKVSVMSTSAQTHFNDNCHYFYPEYKAFAENIYRLVYRDLYGGPTADNINAPNIKFAEAGSNGSAITLIMEDILDSITWASGAQADFKFYGGSPTVSTGSCQRNRVLLTLSGSANGVTELSYLGHQNSPEPLVTNLNGIGALHFYKFPLTTPRYRDSVSLAAILKSNNITQPIDSFAVFGTNGRIVTLKLSNRKISKLHPYIGFMDSLKTIDLTANLLSTLPVEITRIAPTNVMVNSNYLCSGSISDTIKQWVNRYSKDVNWQATQLADSLHLCNGAVAAGFRSSNEMAAYSDIQRFIVSVREKCLLLSIARPREVTSIKVLKLNGSIVRQFDHASNAMKIDLKDLSASSLIVQVARGNRMQTLKRITLF